MERESFGRMVGGVQLGEGEKTTKTLSFSRFDDKKCVTLNVSLPPQSTEARCKVGEGRQFSISESKTCEA